MSARKTIPIGTQFHYWTVIADAQPGRRGQTRYVCKCQCGRISTLFAVTLRLAVSKSCGCLPKEINSKRRRSHGHTVGRQSKTYVSWASMHQRCKGNNPQAYQNYAGRGINVCERWFKFENFLADMGERPKGKTLDRYPNNDGNYEPTNCRWATRPEQVSNRRKKETAN